MKFFWIAASRGRNPENPSDRSSGCPTVQRLEINSDGICNTLTTVLKDNYVIEVIEDDESTVTPAETENKARILRAGRRWSV